jgi:hypothetical protein
MPLSASILTRLRHQHETITELIDGLNEVQLKHRVNPDKWSAFENIVHLVTYQHTFIHRLALILIGDGPLFERYVAEKDPLFYDHLRQSLHQIQEDLITNRQIIIKRVGGLNTDELSLTGHHPRYGLMTILQWIEFFLLHEAHHLYTVFSLTQDLRSLQRE